MNYNQIRETDIANGPGIRTSLFVQGCELYCKGCFNSEAWGFSNGKIWDDDIKQQFITLVNRPFIVGATILGGEPLHPKNIGEVTSLIKDIKEQCPGKTVWVYTGFEYEDILSHYKETLTYIDVLVDGQFVEEKADRKLRFRGSSNQRIIDVQKSLEKDSICLCSFE